MKNKLIRLFLTLSLVLGVVTGANIPAAFAAGPGTITVTDTQNGATYQAYKVFDAEVADTSAPDANKDGVAYLIPAGKESDYQNSTNFTNLFTTSSNGGRTYVTKKDTASAADIAAWAKQISSTLTSPVSVTETGTDGTEVINVSDYGYYYVSSSVNNGAVVMVTSVSPNATIHEKNTGANWGDGGGKTADKKSYSVGDTITYTINYNNAVNYDGSEKVYQYVLRDDMPNSNVVALNPSSIKVTVTDASGQETVLTQNNNKAKGTYSYNESNNDFDITIPWSATQTQSTDSANGAIDDFYYKGISKITVTYTGVLKSEAKPGSGDIADNTNTATINPNTQTDDSGKKATVYDGQITIKKVDGSDKAKTLDGATFVLKNDQNQYLNFSDPQAVKWTSDQKEATEYTTANGGLVTIKGLAEGTYKLVETKAPAGYNLMTQETTVVLKEGLDNGQDTLLVTPTIENNKGAELPSTGSIGTIILYTIGALLALGAGVVLVARRRLQS
ncbi:surface protein Spb1 [Streptococcus porcinus]|uniref:SpaH/EbpB family LPXTG-anchored major pilin n=1 Tax=Streptococcus porcinus TaxID=1340 RepID=UPI0010CABD35|nr:SpaH/EbpB family LPXTG-anchored major pilin [Streptococcus porcinus]VTS16674.1 surface protein Spb1 [Streptococcus porcinus]